ncbi:Txe/YoeB family addiction module toxin [Rhodococcus artemisiae]|uniref:Endoribonuclease YoeB n=1 Tax=Rhodococcus artemisiae TaxID=714159 RepID=A0ABU7LF71_9NOCA|nr:Txe/YoeB family addiction module toxin [Rhodococcus artemisiae]MEE2059562.1 Txe/YoeB family addiction module toxin [Rhodococcus artemisiae]
MKVVFTDDAWDDYTHWLTADRRVLTKVNDLIKDIKRLPYEGIGKPERLRHMEGNVWSRRITHEHRLVYVVDADTVIIQQARYHY